MLETYVTVTLTHVEGVPVCVCVRVCVCVLCVYACVCVCCERGLVHKQWIQYSIVCFVHKNGLWY